MFGFRALTIAAVAGVAVPAAAQAIHGGQFGEPVAWTPAFVPLNGRDGTCTELPKLCTGAVMMHGEATTMTYLCPERTQGPYTVHVTVTATTTVTVAATNGAPTVPPVVPSANPSAASSVVPQKFVHSALVLMFSHSLYRSSPQEPTTTTTIKSTVTQYKTITVISKHGSSSLLTLTPPVMASSYTEGVLPLLTSTLTLTTTLPLVNGTTSATSCTESAGNSTVIATTPFFPNTTSHIHHPGSHSGFAAPTMPSFNGARIGGPTGIMMAPSMSASEQTDVPFVTLFVGLIAAAYLA
ncbi:hypothetical protein N0V83_000662 [Neocucurbitaria cava]|uniref:Uncharacterized protein n=1 Tax=Neocucurbitaria cava TaxID=798079 RepID=A0A9W8YH55_9PLEO|nr:hypothetical protein N0V83_000662 [Neocucurbitaria cava]